MTQPDTKAGAPDSDPSQAPALPTLDTASTTETDTHYVVKLAKPVVHYNETLTELRFRKTCTVGDLQSMDDDAGLIGKEVHLAARMADVLPSTIQQVEAREYLKKIQPILALFT
ncbi:MAG: phage tail assembly protein [Cyanobacteria bacterium HKST-UBA05]|nr:phage tail assembly protein [Cyanobacteria bacterium HKST-UBA05]